MQNLVINLVYALLMLTPFFVADNAQPPAPGYAPYNTAAPPPSGNGPSSGPVPKSVSNGSVATGASANSKYRR